MKISITKGIRVDAETYTVDLDAEAFQHLQLLITIAQENQSAVKFCNHFIYAESKFFKQAEDSEVADIKKSAAYRAGYADYIAKGMSFIESNVTIWKAISTTNVKLPQWDNYVAGAKDAQNEYMEAQGSVFDDD